jgi:hypothetical protein
MPWTRSRKIIAALLVISFAAAMAVLFTVFANRTPANRRHVLDDGSVLTLTRVEFGSNVDFAHGNFAQKFLGNTIPSNGVHLGKFTLIRPYHRPFNSQNNKTWLAVEFNLSGPGSTNSPLVKPMFYRQYRYIIYGERGIEYVEELWSEPFKSFSDGY